MVVQVVQVVRREGRSAMDVFVSRRKMFKKHSKKQRGVTEEVMKSNPCALQCLDIHHAKKVETGQGEWRSLSPFSPPPFGALAGGEHPITRCALMCVDFAPQLLVLFGTNIGNSHTTGSLCIHHKQYCLQLLLKTVSNKDVHDNLQ